ncbi:MAG: VanZ family protein [Verrucomicrobia bacterium]|jgi:VanZ family protein|nr:VanZ family protein [Verrucomicrobiota bacterium]
MMQTALRWLLFTAYAGVVAVLSLGPTSDMPKLNVPHADKLAHFGMYALLMLLLQYAMEGEAERRAGRAMAALAICVGYGALMEYGQLTQHFAERMFSWADMVANALGAASAAAILEYRRIPSAA